MTPCATVVVISQSKQHTFAAILCGWRSGLHRLMASCRSAAPVTIEQPHQSDGDGTEIGAAFGGADQQDLAGGSRLREAVRGAMLVSCAFLLDQPLDVGDILDLRALVVAAPVAGEHLGAVDDAHLVWIGENGQSAPDVVVGNRVIVQVEADIGRLADSDRDMFEQRRRIVGQRQQASHFLSEHLADRAVRFIGAASVGGRAVAPDLGLGIEVIEIFEASGSKKRIAGVSDGALDATFFVTARDRHGARFIAILPGKAQQGRMETDRVAAPFQHHAFEIVVQVRHGEHRAMR